MRQKVALPSVRLKGFNIYTGNIFCFKLNFIENILLKQRKGPGCWTEGEEGLTPSLIKVQGLGCLKSLFGYQLVSMG